MKKIKYLTLLAMAFYLAGCASMGEGTREEKQQQILKMKIKVLKKLYKHKPDVESQIQSAPGYAVFSNAGMSFFIVSAGTGYGVVEEVKTGKKFYMNMAEGGLALGLGVKDYRIVMIFHKKKAMEDFINYGWKFGGNADAAAKSSDKGGALGEEVYSGDVTVYSFTKNGIALQAAVKGTKFWVDTNLN